MRPFIVNVIKVIAIAMVYSFGGALVITLLLDPKEHETLVRSLNLFWNFIVYFSYAIPAIDEIRKKEAEEHRKNTKDDTNNET